MATLVYVELPQNDTAAISVGAGGARADFQALEESFLAEPRSAQSFRSGGTRRPGAF